MIGPAGFPRLSELPKIDFSMEEEIVNPEPNHTISKRIHWFRHAAAVSTFIMLSIAVISCVYSFRESSLVSLLSASGHGKNVYDGDVKDQIENDSASHLLIKNDVKLAIMLSGEAEKVYIQTDSLKAKEKAAMDSALAEKRAGVEKMNYSNSLELKSKELISKSQKLRDEFNQQGKWAADEEKRSQEASKDYRHDVLRLANDISKISILRSKGKTVPADLAAQVKNITHQMAVDSQRSKAGYSDLSKRAEMRSSLLAGASGKNAAELTVPATSWSLQQESAKEKAKAAVIISSATKKIEHIQSLEAMLKSPFSESECLEK
jgi:hypothetical protein